MNEIFRGGGLGLGLGELALVFNLCKFYNKKYDFICLNLYK